MGLRCARARVVLAVSLGMTSKTWLAGKSYEYVGAEHLYDQKNHEEISPRNLRRCDTCDLIGVDIYTTHQNKYKRIVCESGEDALGNLFASPFLRNVKNSLTCFKNSKYNFSQEI